MIQTDGIIALPDMSFVEKAFKTIKEVSPLGRRRQAELRALYSTTVRALGDNPRYITAPGVNQPKVEYAGVGSARSYVEIYTLLPKGSSDIQSPPRVNIHVGNSYIGEDGEPWQEVGEYTVERDEGGRFKLCGKMPVPTGTGKKTHIWSREPRKPLQLLIDQLPNAQRLNIPDHPVSE